MMIEANGILAKKVDRFKTQTRGDAPEDAVHRVHEHVLPDKRRHGGHHEEWRNDHDADDPGAEHWSIQQNRGEEPADRSDGQHASDQHQSVLDRSLEAGIGNEPVIVFPARKRRRTDLQQVVSQERKVKGQTERDEHPAQKQQHGGRDHQSRGGSGRFRGHSHCPPKTNCGSASEKKPSSGLCRNSSTI